MSLRHFGERGRHLSSGEEYMTDGRLEAARRIGRQLAEVMDLDTARALCEVLAEAVGSSPPDNQRSNYPEGSKQ